MIGKEEEEKRKVEGKKNYRQSRLAICFQVVVIIS